MKETTKTPSTGGHVFVARLPILNRDRRVYGYELLFRASALADASGEALDYAAARVISDALLAIGLETLTDGRRAFVRVSRRLLLDGIPSVLPPERVVLEMAADIEADRDVVEACQELRNAGYQIAVDDFVLTDWTADLVPLANFLKVDFLTTDPEVRKVIEKARTNGAPVLIAKSIETMDAFDQAVKEGYTYFQGFFFGRPVIAEGREVPVQQMANLRLLRALHVPDLSVHQLEELIKHDASLCYRILRTVNSAAYMLQVPVQSIRQALVLLGRDTVRRWASLWSLAGLEEHHGASELVVMATVRARCCELLAGSLGGEEAASEGFLIGMCSLLDAILGRPMKAVLADLPLAEETEAALLGEDNAIRRLLDCVIAYEHGEWERAEQLAGRAKINPALLPKAFADALRWSREIRGVGSGGA
jgi:EAL and modified HD-GYP domain-containing signal transduction protein